MTWVNERLHRLIIIQLFCFNIFFQLIVLPFFAAKIQTFRIVEYEDELDLLAVVVTDGKDGEGRAHVRLHDNQSGKLLRTVELTESWDEVTDLPWLHWYDTGVPPCSGSWLFVSLCLPDLSTWVILWQGHNCSRWTKEHVLLLSRLQAQHCKKIRGRKPSEGHSPKKKNTLYL